VRWDGGYAQGDSVSQHYDNLIGKLVVWGPDREAARHRMLRALGEFEITGVSTTIPAHVALLSHPGFAAAEHSTKWVEDEIDLDTFVDTAAASTPATAGDEEAEPLLERTVPVEVDGKRYSVKLWLPEASAGAAAPKKRSARPRPGVGGSGGAAGSGTISAPMQGTIVKVLVAVGDAVDVGESVLVLEAMKMENHISAEKAGTVAEVRVAEGDTVGTGDVLLVIE
jgi:acetyl-CoA/propionyl-CoA carboxylase biotin carboxyl carrier protein